MSIDVKKKLLVVKCKTSLSNSFCGLNADHLDSEKSIFSQSLLATHTLTIVSPPVRVIVSNWVVVSLRLVPYRSEG